MSRSKTADYKNGYGDCKADLLRMVQEALKCMHEACHEPDGYHGVFDPSDNKKKELQFRIAELRRLRTMVKALKPG